MSIYCKRLEQCINWNRLVTTLLTLQSCYKLSTTSQILRVSTSLSQSVSTTCDKSAERYVVTSLWSQACCNVWNWQHCYKLVHRLVTSLQANKLVTNLWEIWPCTRLYLWSLWVIYHISLHINGVCREGCHLGKIGGQINNARMKN